MRVWIDIMIAVAAAAVFFLIEKYLLEWPYPWNVISSISVFVVAAALAFILRRKNADETKRGANIMSNNDVQKDMNASIDGGKATQPP